MKFPELLILAIQRSEIPLRFEPGAEEAVAQPVTDFVRAWIETHQPAQASSEFDRGQQVLIARLLAELEGALDVPE